MTTENDGERSRPNYRFVEVALAVYSIAALVGIVALSWVGREAPESLIATLGMAVGALAGVLSSKT